MRSEARRKLSASLKAIGHRPPVHYERQGPTVPEALVLEALGPEWVLEHPVTIRQGGEYQGHYRIDVANIKEKIAVELDGPSHKALIRVAHDQKRDAYLVSLGWRVFRFPNSVILSKSSTSKLRAFLITSLAE